MKIISLKIKNTFLGWEFKDIKFTSNLTLLVGISGVGKTQILKAIKDLQSIANGQSINGFEWKITFSTVYGNEFTWTGAFSVLENNENLFDSYSIKEDAEAIKPIILFEQLINNQTANVIIDRTQKDIRFNGLLMPKLSSNQSMIAVLKEEKSIKEVLEAFNKIKFKDNTVKENGISYLNGSVDELKDKDNNKYKTVEDIKNSDESIRVKLLLCAQLNLTVFNDIKSRFIDIFPQVEDMIIEQKEISGYYSEFGKNGSVVSTPIISIKEKDVPKWISEKRMSSGMMRTIIHICEIFLSNDGSVILIDEFENSLGINCIDTLTDDLIHENKNLQFIATSHHPYIINNIPYEYWKIVSRKGGMIQVRDAANYNLGKSKQNAFIQLIKILEKRA